ncbi:hypothetical protein [Haloferula sp. A504]|uniref:hypothetical protein n=1 Tax=Haloferula sp. A504 TaxID=3373601 RepID=UPI0031C31FB1|nr:hypothetical protein [Verrucomicrobiaceae bacterium E54]
MKMVAKAIGGDTSSAVALMGVIFNGILEPGFCDYTKSSDPLMDELRSFHLGIVDDEGSVAAVVRWLLTPIREFQQDWGYRFRDVQPEQLKQFLLSKNPANRSDDDDYLSCWYGGISDRLGFDPERPLRNSPQGRLRLVQYVRAARLVRDELLPHLDFLLHPRVLVEETPLGQTMQAIKECHGALALVYGGWSIPYSCRRTYSGKYIFGFLSRGGVVEKWSSFQFRTPTASLIFHAESADWKDPEVPCVVCNALLFQPRRAIGSQESLLRVDPPEEWTQALGKELAARPRAETRYGWWDEEQAERSAFEKRYRRYLKGCKEMKVRVLRHLPVLIYRMLRAVYSFHKTTPSKRQLADAAFRHARILRKRHADLWERLAYGRVLQEPVNLPNQIAKTIREMQPIDRNYLLRGLNPRQLRLRLTTLDWLLCEGVILEDSAGDYVMGPEPDLDGKLRRMRESVWNANRDERVSVS